MFDDPFADPPPDPNWHHAMLHDLAQTAMAYAHHVHIIATKCQGTPLVDPQTGLLFARLARCVRQTIALDRRLANAEPEAPAHPTPGATEPDRRQRDRPDREAADPPDPAELDPPATYTQISTEVATLARQLPPAPPSPEAVAATDWITYIRAVKSRPPPPAELPPPAQPPAPTPAHPRATQPRAGPRRA